MGVLNIFAAFLKEGLYPISNYPLCFIQSHHTMRHARTLREIEILVLLERMMSMFDYLESSIVADFRWYLSKDGSLYGKGGGGARMDKARRGHSGHPSNLNLDAERPGHHESLKHPV